MLHPTCEVVGYAGSGGCWKIVLFLYDDVTTKDPIRTGFPSAGLPGFESSNVSVRRLIHIPVIHSQADMGSLRSAIQALTVKKQGAQGWARNVNVIEGLWVKIEEAIACWSLPYEKMRLYQDGLPVCGRELEIVSELAKAGSRNHQLLLRLKERGAILMGTESAELLVQEYKLIKQMLTTDDSATAARLEIRHQEVSRSLLKRRDQAIADRINHTLCPGESGLLFLGMLHSIERWLAEDIQVTHPLYPPLLEGRE